MKNETTNNAKITEITDKGIPDQRDVAEWIREWGMRGAPLHDTDFSEADFRYALFVKAMMQRTNLSNINFAMSDFTESIIWDSDITDMVFRNNYIIKDGERVDVEVIIKEKE